MVLVHLAIGSGCFAFLLCVVVWDRVVSGRQLLNQAAQNRANVLGARSSGGLR